MTDDISTLRSHHIQSQFAAANPKKSVWVSANAGAGKTRVLVDRIIRMMLPPFHALPHKILCMTFTKAAATEMSQRLFDRLGGWIALSDNELSAELKSLTGELPDKNTILMARRLFALALETPGGLKIQTIHGFCEQILRKFPVESGTPTDFKIIQDGDILKILKLSLIHI
jgi:ATP-dependent helicase/nuclease subunit A